MHTIFFDIETGPLPEGELAALLPPFDPAEVKTGNIKDPAKIAEKIREAEEAHRRDFFDRAALDPLTGRVLAIGMMTVTPQPGPLPDPLPDPHPALARHPLPLVGRGTAGEGAGGEGGAWGVRGHRAR